MNIMKPLLTLLACLIGAAACATRAAEETDPRLHSNGQAWGIYQDGAIDAKLPRVILIGDSILNGYQGAVKAQLKGRATVDVWVTGICESDPTLPGQLRKVLAKGPYDIVHFNIGLHGWPKGRIKDGEYEPLMRNYVKILKEGAPKAVLIWASSTPVTVKGKPRELNPDINPVIVERNAAAAKLMAENGVLLNDLYELSAKHLSLARGDMFHWNGPGSAMQGKAVAAIILANLPKRTDVSALGTVPPGITPARTRGWFPWSPKGMKIARQSWTPESRRAYEARITWFHEAKWGLLCDFLAYAKPMLAAPKGPLSARPPQTWTSADWNAWVDAVDVEKFADQAKELGVGYVILTLGQWHQFTCGPNPVADQLWGFKPGQYNATRDLPMDLGKALAKRNIPLMLYIMAEDPNRYPRPAGWTPRDVRNAWLKATEWYSDHYGTLCKGWWVDGLGTVDPKAKVEAAADYCAQFVKALKHGNPDALVGCGVYEISDFTQGHCMPDWKKQSRECKPYFGRWDPDYHIQYQTLQYVGCHWGAAGTAYPKDQVVAYVADTIRGGGVFTFDVGAVKTVDDKAVGPVLELQPDQLDQLRAVRDAIKDIPASDGRVTAPDARAKGAR